MDETVRFRRSAAVCLVGGTPSNPTAFLVERNPKLRFFGGYWAFPGGVADRLSDGTPESFTHCAARELFEETGVMVPEWQPHFAGTSEDQLRRTWLDGEGDSANHTASAPEPISLTRLGVMRTPAFAPVRYETEFFAHFLQDESKPEIWPGELVGGDFLPVDSLLDEWSRGERLIVPPVRTLLSMLREFGSADFIQGARERLDQYAAGKQPPIMNTPGICMIPLRTPTVPPATTTNHYLVGAQEMVLIDPGTPYGDEQAKLIAFIEERVAAGCELKGLVLTHHHHDHAGGLKALEAHFGVPVFAHAETFQRLPFAVEQARVLKDGDRLPLGRSPDGKPGWYLEAVETPGHALGHLVFMDSRYGVCLGGDLASTVSTIVIEPPEGHLRTYLQSLQKVIDRRPTLFYPAHGPVARDAVRLLEHYQKHRAQREQRLIDVLLAGGDASLDALVAQVYDDVDPRMHRWAAQSLEAGLIKLEEDGLAERSGAGWRCLPRV